MKIQRLNPVDMSVVEDSVTGLSFGTVYQGNYCEELLTVRPTITTESSLTEMKLFLESKGPFKKSTFGYLNSLESVSGLLPGFSGVSGVFSEVPNASLSDNGGLGIVDGENVWLSVKLGDQERGTYDGINYRFVYDFN